MIDLPYVVAGKGGSTLTVSLSNPGDLPLTGPAGGALVWSLAGDPAITMGAAPGSLAAGEHAELTLAYAGAAAETIASAVLTVETAAGTRTAKVYAVAGDPALGSGMWDPLEGPNGEAFGDGLTVSMPRAPFPHASAPWTDDSVHVFLPEGYRERGAQDLVVHFHGFSTTLGGTLAGHLYREHVYASGSNAVLVVPQGPVDAPSGDFGKLMAPGGLDRLLTEVLVLLYREQRIEAPVLGELVLTSHSGGYQAVAYNLGAAAQVKTPFEVELFDSLYGDIAAYQSYAESKALYRSDYTLNGGTKTNNEAFVAALEGAGMTVETTQSQRALAGSDPVIFYAPTTHEGSTRIDGAYGEELRFALGHSRHGPRVELRSAVATGGVATVKWLAPRDEDTTGFRVQTSPDGAVWTTQATTPTPGDHASFALPAGGARVRILPVVNGLPDAAILGSDVYRVDDAASILVVDGFDRVLDGSYAGLAHDFSARVGEAAGKVASASHRAIVEDGLDPGAFKVVIWLDGDESVGDHALAAPEQAALEAFVQQGGALVASGSEIAFELDATAAGAAFLDGTFGATFVADNAASHLATGEGPLAALGAVAFSGPGAPYQENDPDGLGVTGGGVTVLQYDSGAGAAVGVAGHAVLVGFPLELVDDPVKRAALVKALVTFAGG